jgi:sodium-dependent dicarboxylate transporter 2/3/5
MPAYKKKGFLIGLALFFLMMLIPPPAELSSAGWIVAAIAVLMAVWWATEAIPVAVTALLPLALFPLLDITSFETAALPYANKNIYLFLGGFILALGIESSGLHKRIALKMILAVGSSGAKLIGGFMLVSALISMWVMNTSTTLMLLPIGLAVCGVISQTVPGMTDTDKANFDTALLLGIAYAATIGGMSTLIGTAPNIVFSAFMQDTYGVEISMFDWMKLGVPLAAVMLFGSWYSLTQYVFPIKFSASQEAKDELKKMLNEMGTLTKDEIRISIIFGLAVFAWVFRTLLNNIEFLSGLTDAGIAIIAAILLFMTPSASKKGDLLKWEKSKELPWGLLLLFGGGLSLAAQISSTGLGMWIGQSLMVLSTVPPIVLILAVATLIIFLTEITSNVTTTTTFLPVFGALAVAIGILPVSLTVPVCLAASCAFMLPVATPPNAIVYGSNKFTIATMMRAGIALNIIGIIVVTMFAYFLAPAIF